MPSAAASAAPLASAEVPRGLDRAAAQALLNSWLAAQNAGDFAAYERLYAPRFTGIKRTGERKWTFDRASWLADRKGMFAHPMAVSMSEPQFTVTPSAAIVRLVQAWSSATYEDVGQKQLVLVPTPAGPRITREEMLNSKISGGESAALAQQLMLLERGELILLHSPPTSWAAEASALDRKRGPYVVTRAARLEQLPPELAAWQGRELRVVDAAGRTCESKVTLLKIRAEVVPHFGAVNEWNAEPSGSRDTRTASEIWSLSEAEGRWLVAELSPACSGLWVLPLDKAPPPAAAPEQPSPALAERVLSAFRALPGYQRLEKEFRAEQPKARGRWEDYGEHSIEVSVFRPASLPALVSVAARAGQGCGDFYGQLGAIFRMNPKGDKLELLDTPAELGVKSAFDLDGDGTLELLIGPDALTGRTSLWRQKGKGGALQLLHRVPSYDCPC